MKKAGLMIFIVAISYLTACGADRSNEEVKSSNTTLEITADAKENEEKPITKNNNVLDEAVYIGEYLDGDVEEPNLEIAKGNNGKYIVQIGIFRLTLLDDGVGEMCIDGLCFTATDSAGNPIQGIIKSDGKTATVTFTDSTWEYLPNGSSFQYTKTSDKPKLWKY